MGTLNLDYAESTYTFLGTVRLMKHVFSSDEKDPLVFKLVKDKGFMHVKGSGKVQLPDGDILTIPSKEANSMAELVISFKDLQPDQDSTLQADIVRTFKGGAWVYDPNIPPRDVNSTIYLTEGSEKLVLSNPKITFEDEITMLMVYDTCKVIQIEGKKQSSDRPFAVQLIEMSKKPDHRICIRVNLKKGNEWVVQRRTSANKKGE